GVESSGSIRGHQRAHDHQAVVGKDAQPSSMYELLSEYAHPNYNGMIGVYQRITGGASIFVDHPADAHRDQMKTAVGMVGTGLLLVEWSAAQYRDALPAFIRLCE